jgi:hypothetical protein
MNTPDIKTVRNVVIALTIAVAILWLGAEVRATEIASEIASDSADRSANLPLANLSSTGFVVSGFAAPEISSAGLIGAEMSAADVSGTKWAHEAERAASPSLLAADEAQPSDEAAFALGRGDGDSDSLDVSLATWFSAAADLSSGDPALVDTFVLALAAIRSTDAVNWVCDTFWELQELEGPVTVFETRPLRAELRERDSFTAAEVAGVLGNVAAPDPDVVFLAFVFLQSLWGLACRPRE